jgi:predicted AlkP superfamily pyrophosphatase or phosphodiesterase
MSQRDRKFVEALVLCGTLFVTVACTKQSCEAPASIAAVAPSARHTVVQNQGPIRRVVLITIDGLKPENYLCPDEQGLKVPTLRWLAGQGAVSDGVQSVFPTLTYPAHTSLVTGVNPSRHGIVGNRSFDPLEDDLEGWRWYAEDIAVDPIWRVAEQQGLKTALIHLPVSVGAKVSWLVPEYWRAKNLQDQKLLRSVSTDGLLESVARRHPDFWSRYLPPNVTDDSLTDIALDLLTEQEPSLLILHLIEVDAAQHKFGIGSAEARAAIERDDRQVGRILEVISRRGLTRETAVVVASDHGFRSANQVVRPCTLLTEAGFMTVEGGKITSYQATVLANAGTAYVYVNDNADDVTRQRVRDLFVAKQKDPKSGIGQLYDATEIRALGGDPKALLAMGAATDFQFGGGCLGAYVGPSGYRATHGFDPRDPEMRASLLMVGPSIPHGKIPGARLIDIAPTIAAWLKLPLRQAEGIPLRVVTEPKVP